MCTVCLQSVFELVNIPLEKRLPVQTSAIHRRMRSTRGPENDLIALLELRLAQCSSKQDADLL